MDNQLLLSPEDITRLEFKSSETFLPDVMELADRCTAQMGEMHLIFQDDNGTYYIRHICHPYDQAWHLVYSANPYHMNS